MYPKHLLDGPTRQLQLQRSVLDANVWICGQRNKARSQVLRVHRAPSLVMPHVILLGREQPQVTRTVVALLSILVVNTLLLPEWSAENVLSHESVLKAVSPQIRLRIVGSVLVAIWTVVHGSTDTSTRARFVR